MEIFTLIGLKVSSPNTHRAVFYARVSTADQIEGTSLGTQQAWCRGQIQTLGWQFVDEYIDAGLSGADSNRPQWQRLLADARAGKFQSVFVYDLDRFTRDMLDGLQATRELRALGITLHDAKNPDMDVASADSQFMTGIRLLVAEEERRAIKERTVRGQRAKLTAGEWAGGKPSYGWRLEGIRTRRATPVPDETERQNLRIMFSLVVHERLTTGEVCERLAELGIESRNGGRWSHTMVKRVLSNPTLHTGWFIWGEPKGGSTDGRSHKTKIDSAGRPLYGQPTKVHLPEPPFSTAEFDAVQRAFKRHPRAGLKPSPSQPRLLTGRIYGECGRYYTSTSLAGKDYAIYRCTGNRYRGRNSKQDRCGCRQINAQRLEARVWAEIGKFLGRPDRLVGMAMKWLEISDDQPLDDVRTRLESITVRERKLNRAIQKLKDELYLEDAEDKADLRDRLSRFQSDLAGLTEQRRGLQAFLDNASANASNLHDLNTLAAHAKNRLDLMSDTEKLEAIQLLKIKVFISEIEASEPKNISLHGLVDPSIFEGTEHWRRIPTFEFQFEEAEEDVPRAIADLQ
jgi:DNA invertase Pin-like site-specific DNA recombinase